MITSIHGTLVATSPLLAVIETGGLGYDVHIPMTTAEKLPATGTQVKLHTLAVYREDAQTLYGFATAEERDFFRLLIEHVTGVGPKGALTIMSKLSLSLLENAIRAGDITTLANCSGIGKKTAERLVVELKSKLGAPAAGESISLGSSSPAGAAVDSKQHDAVMALMALGYKAADADQAVRRAALALSGRVTTEALVKKALNG
jgi:Holliday junction DNA helicase RuvA